MKTQADLYEAAARVMRMCEGTDVNWPACVKFEGLQGSWKTFHFVSSAQKCIFTTR